MSTWNVHDRFPAVGAPADGDVAPGVYGGPLFTPWEPLLDLAEGVANINDLFPSGYPDPAVRLSSTGHAETVGFVVVTFDDWDSSGFVPKLLNLPDEVVPMLDLLPVNCAVTTAPTFSDQRYVPANLATVPPGNDPAAIGLTLGTGPFGGTDEWADLLAGQSLFVSIAASFLLDS